MNPLMNQRLASLLAVAGLAAMASAQSAVPLRRAFGPDGGSWRVARPSKRYPEQSSRQAMRGARRAQGGPGIELVEGVYRAKAAA